MHVAAALTRLPKLVRYRGKDLVKTDAVAPKGSGVRAEVPVDGALPRRLDSERAEAIARTLCAQIPQHTSRMFPRQAANCVWALGTLHSKGVKVTEPGWGQEDRLDRGGISGSRRGGESTSPLADSPRMDDAYFKDTLEGMVARMEAAGMSPIFSHAYASLLEIVSANTFRAMEAHGQPAEAAQLLKGKLGL